MSIKNFPNQCIVKSTGNLYVALLLSLVAPWTIFLLYKFILNQNGSPYYLLLVTDGETWSYNDGPNDAPEPCKEECERYIGNYSYYIKGEKIDKLKIYKQNNYLYLDGIKLKKCKPDFYFSFTGEVLNFNNKNNSWRNITIIKN